MAKKPKPPLSEVDALKAEVAKLTKLVRSQGRRIDRLTLILRDIDEKQDEADELFNVRQGQAVETFNLIASRFGELMAATNRNGETLGEVVDALNDLAERAEAADTRIDSNAAILGGVFHAVGLGKVLQRLIAIDLEHQASPEPVDGAVVVPRRRPIQA